MDKPFKSINEQLTILQSRNIKTDNRTACILEREGYYSIVNGYKDAFLAIPHSDIYKPGTTFEDIYQLFKFDRALRLILFGYFSIAEAILKTTCAYNFMERYREQSNPYMNKNNYSQNKHHRAGIDRLLDEFNNILCNHSKNKNHKLYLEHYLNNHDEVPFWVLTKCLTLGQIFKFFCFQQESMRNSIAHSFSNLYAETHKEAVRISDRRLRLAYNHIKDFMNICAHDERLYCARVSLSHDTNFADVLNDLELVLPKNEYMQLLKDVVNALIDLSENTHIEIMNDVMNSMGISSLDPIIATS